MYDDHDVVELIVGDIFRAMLGLDVQALPGADDTAGADGDEVGSSVLVSGGWSGAVVLRCSAPLAGGIARRMFAPGGEVVDDPELLADALGEVVNMIAGNLKTMLPGPCQLSLPERQDDPPPQNPFSSAPLATVHRFGCEGHSVTVWVLPSVPVPTP